MADDTNLTPAVETASAEASSKMRLLTPPYNFAVVQLPDKESPGVVFQGDTLHSILADVGEMQRLLFNRELAQLSENYSRCLKSYRLSKIPTSTFAPSRALACPILVEV